MKADSSIQTILFDLGGVILPFDHTLIVQRLEKHCSFPPSEIRNVFFGDGLVQRYCLGQMTSQAFFQQVRNILGLHCGFGEFARAWSDIFTENREVSGLIRCLSACYPLYLLSE